MMKRLLALLIATLLVLTGTALAEDYAEDLTFEYDYELFEITKEERTEEDLYVVLTGKVAEWGDTSISIYLDELKEGEAFPTVEDFSKVETETGNEVTQGTWNGFEDVIMFSAALEDGSTESVFIAPIYDAAGAVEKSLSVRVNASDVESMERDDAISEVLDTLAITDWTKDGREFDVNSLHIEASPEWLTALPQAQDENVKQLFVVAGMDMGLTTASISMHERDEEGNWNQILSTPGFVGKNGLCLDEEHAEGCGQTPVGVYHFNKAFGIAADPGCALPYVQVDEDTYWSGDPEYHYNEMMDIDDYPELAMDDSEHIIDYTYQYQYCLNISFNEEGTPGRGSAIFLHCLGPVKPYTGGCVAIPQNIMQLVMENVREDCVVVIDTVENLGVTF